MPDSNEDHPSRRHWPAPLEVPAETEPVPDRVGRQITPPILVAYGAIAVQTVAMILLIVMWVYPQQQYIDGRGEYRDRENERLEQRITDAVCDLLDQLPEGGLLDRPRDKYGCGPGIPLSEFPEDVRRRYTGESAPTPAPPTTAPAPATTQPPQPTPNEPPAGNSPKPTPDPAAPTTPPTGVLDPVTDTVCDLLPICIEEP